MVITDYYKVGIHCFSLTTPFRELLPPLIPYKSFIYPHIPEKCSFDMTVTDKDLPQLNGKEVTRFDWEGAECIISSDGQIYEVSINPQSGNTIYRMHTNREFTKITGELKGIRNSDFFVLNNYLMMCYTFSNSPRNTLMIHASVIKKDGFGYLFMGRSGTGKSTHSRLWLENIDGSELLNDDNPVVQITENGDIMVYGTPWSGKTPCYKNEGVPVGAFVKLAQAPHNKITQLGEAHAFATIFPSCSCFKQDETIYNDICDTVIDIASRTSAFKLECLPDRDAAILCHNSIKMI